jgi:ribonuclease T1
LDKTSEMRRRFQVRYSLMQAARVVALAMLLLVSGGLPWAFETSATIRAENLPAHARDTLDRIRHGGPFPFARDGAVFANREGRLPHAPRGSYREYTVVTPGSRDRGARRIIAADGSRYWYSADHYNSFRRIVE